MEIKDAMKNSNVQAFLKAIRLGEGTLDAKGYNRIVGGQLFSDMSKHPQVKVWIPRYKVWSSAAGAYQIIYPTWVGLVKYYKFDNFEPETQDLAAIALIKGRRALDDVAIGDFYKAIYKCSKEWASLPGSKAGQRIENINDITQVYKDNGGIIRS